MAKNQAKAAEAPAAVDGDAVDLEKKLAELEQQLDTADVRLRESEAAKEALRQDLDFARSQVEMLGHELTAAHMDRDLAVKRAEQLEQQLADLASDKATAEFAEAYVVKLKKDCGGLKEGTKLALALLRKGVSLNFAVDAVRSGVAMAVKPEPEPESGDEVDE